MTKYDTTTFEYDGLGRRTKKSKDGTNISFVYDSDGRLIKQGSVFEFIYDNAGLVGFKYNNGTYFYRKDAQDIIAILDSSGEVVSTYTYDAWGDHVVGGSNTKLGNLNPFRYRGYYFDTETGLYYLQTRYYDPGTGRFISQDDPDYADPETINGLNLYAYCLNNPVMMTDETGNMPRWLKWVLGGVALLGAVVLTFVTGGAVAPVLAGFAGSVLIGGFTQATITAIGGGNFWDGFLEGAADGALWGGIFAFGGAIVRTVKIANIAKKGITIGKTGLFENIAKSSGTYYYKGLKSHGLLRRLFGQKFADSIGWVQNKSLLKGVMNFKGVIFNAGGDLTGAYAKEIFLTKGYKYLFNIWLF